MRSFEAWFASALAVGALAACLPADLSTPYDADRDGWLSDQDCDDDNGDVYPGAYDPYGDGIDQDCDGFDGSSTAEDSDGDGFVDWADCDPEDPETYPGAPDPYGDGIDQDCDECGEDAGDGIDRDCDGYPANTTVEEHLRDCDDEDADIHPYAEEDCDSVDNDCSGVADDAWACDPGDCGDGTWGSLAPGSEAVFVNIEAPAGGDGTREQPFQSIRDGLDAAVERGAVQVVIAAGTYLEYLEIGAEHGGLHLAGRCAELVVLDASHAGQGIPGIEILAEETGVVVSGLTVQGASYMGVLVGAGPVELSHVVVRECDYGIAAYAEDPGAPPTVIIDGSELSDNVTVGLFAQDAGSTLEVSDCGVVTTQGDGSGYGWGVYLQDGAQLIADGLVLEDNENKGVGVYGEGSMAALTSCSILDTTGTLDTGAGLEVGSGAALVAEDLTVRGSEGYGVHVSGADSQVTLTDVEVTYTQLDSLGLGGALVVEDGASLDATDMVVKHSEWLGIDLHGAGTTGVLSAVEVEDVQGDERGWSYGLLVEGGALVQATDLAVLRTELAGISVTGEGSSLDLVQGVIDEIDTSSGEFLGGWGLWVQEEGTALVDGLEVSDCSGAAVVVISDGSLDASDTKLYDSQFAGVAIEGGRASLDDVVIQGVEESPDLGYGCGIYARNDGGAPELTLQRIIVDDTQVAAVWLAGSGTYTIEDNELAGGSGVPHGTQTRCGDGVYAADIGAEELLLSGNIISDAEGVGLFLNDAWATLSGNTWTDNELDLLVQGEACLTPLEGYDEVGSSEICPAFDSPSCHLDFSLTLEVSEIDPD